MISGLIDVVISFSSICYSSYLKQLADDNDQCKCVGSPLMYIYYNCRTSLSATALIRVLRTF